MAVTWDILYRGPLDSCNYDCGYCPFAKRTNTRAQLEDDRVKLERFVAWVGARTEARIGVLFTPWGEALIHRPYQRAVAELSRMPHVYRVAIQTNLSGPLGWLAETERGRVALWATWHPSETGAERFLARCGELAALGVRHSVGVVGVRGNIGVIERMRAALPGAVYLWINADKDTPGGYTEEEVRRLEAVDPWFSLDRRGHRSLGRECHAGETSFAVDGDGTMHRCHFLREAIGNIYAAGFQAALRPRACTRLHCRCHIGYVNLKHLKLREVYGEGLLERIPREWPQTAADAAFSKAARTVQA